jgi:hypothetical protein
VHIFPIPLATFTNGIILYMLLKYGFLKMFVPKPPSYSVKVFSSEKLPKSFDDNLEEQMKFVEKIYKTVSTSGKGHVYLGDYLDEDTGLAIRTLASEVTGNSEYMRNLPPLLLTKEHLATLGDMAELLQEQMDYIYDFGDESDCKINFLLATIKGVNYGGVFVFSSKAESVMMQGITKYLVPILLKFYYPEVEELLPRLNSVLLPQIEAVARSEGKRAIYVAPIGRQGYFLETYYGFKRTNFVDLPCSSIQVGSDEFYVKELPEDF